MPCKPCTASRHEKTGTAGYGRMHKHQACRGRHSSHLRGRALCRHIADRLASHGALLLIVSFFLFHAALNAQVIQTRRVLILNEENATYPGINIINQAIQAELNRSPYQLQLYAEYMDTTLFPDPAVQQEFRDSFIRRYRSLNLDVIITVGPSPLKFIKEVHQKAFPGVPIVFCLRTPGVPGPPINDADAELTGVEDEVAARETVGLALRLLPGTRNVVVVGGVAAIDREILANVKKQLMSYEGRVEISYLTDLPMPDLLERLRRLPSNTIILLTSIAEDAAGTSFKSNESSPLIIGAANVPVFSLFDVHLNHGEVGGDLYSMREQGKAAGALTLRILRGAKVREIPRVKAVNTYMFDWRALKRWGLKESALPPGSNVINRQPTVWESYKWYIIGGISLIMVEALLIFALLWQRRRRRTVEKELETTYERLRMAIEAGRYVGWDWDAKAGINHWFGDVKGIFGISSEIYSAEMGEFLKRVHPDERDFVGQAIETARQSRQPYVAEFRIVREDGTVRWLIARGKFHYASNGDAARMLGLAADITERKQAEESLRELNRILEQQTVLLQTREELLKTFVKSVPVGVAMFDRDMRYLQVSDRWCSERSVERSQILGRSHYEIFPDMPEQWKQAHRRGLGGETLRAEEDRWDRQEGTIWHRWEIRPWQKPGGDIGGILIFVEDITGRKQMEQALAGISGKLIEAQEQERKRIGRELHDDISQRLALLAVDLERLHMNPSQVPDRLQELQTRLIEVGNDVQVLSHELHSSKIEYLGLVAGIKSWCREFAERHKTDVDFRNELFTAPPTEVGLCLFRVLQEAMNNAFKYSGAARIEVRLTEQSGEVHLTVADSGSGFDLEAAKHGKGLGLTSMEERVRLVHGSIAIDSRPARGTTVHVRVPLTSESVSQSEAG